MVTIETSSILPIKNIRLLRMLARLLPLRHRLYPLVSHYKSYPGLLAISFGKYQLLYPAAWLSPLRSHIIFRDVEHYSEFALFKSILSKLTDEAIIDVGANFGEWVLMTRACTELPIVAYEPSPVSAAIMQRTVEYNGLKDIDVRNKACGNSTSDIVLDTGIVSYINHSEQDLLHEAKQASEATLALTNQITNSRVPISIPQVRLDDDLEGIKKIGLLKIDCEGYEYEILQGAQKIIETQRPYIYLEIHPGQIEAYGHTPLDVIDLLRPYYNMEFFADNGSTNDEQEVLAAIKRATPSDHVAGWPIRFQVDVICRPK